FRQKLSRMPLKNGFHKDPVSTGQLSVFDPGWYIYQPGSNTKCPSGLSVCRGRYIYLPLRRTKPGLKSPRPLRNKNLRCETIVQEAEVMDGIYTVHNQCILGNELKREADATYRTPKHSRAGHFEGA